MKLINVIKWLVIYIKRDWRQLYNYLYIDNYSLLSIKYSKYKSIPLNQQPHIPKIPKFFLKIKLILYMNLSAKNKNSYWYIIFSSIWNMWPIWLSFSSWLGTDLTGNLPGYIKACLRLIRHNPSFMGFKFKLCHHEWVLFLSFHYTTKNIKSFIYNSNTVIS
jgi:hypothetical protein